MDFTYQQPWYIGVLRYIYYDIESIQSTYRFKYLLEENDVFGEIWRLFQSFAGNRGGVDYYIRISTDDYQAQSIDGKLVESIDGEATRELMTNQKN